MAANCAAESPFRLWADGSDLPSARKRPGAASPTMVVNDGTAIVCVVVYEKRSARRKERSAAVSTLGPPSWKVVSAKHREVLDIPWTPLEKPGGCYSKW